MDILEIIKALILEKPRILESPKDAVVQEGSDAIFYCQVTGDPIPTIIWKKLDGHMSSARF